MGVIVKMKICEAYIYEFGPGEDFSPFRPAKVENGRFMEGKQALKINN